MNKVSLHDLIVDLDHFTPQLYLLAIQRRLILVEIAYTGDYGVFGLQGQDKKTGD
jgi:hypothetical protein